MVAECKWLVQSSLDEMYSVQVTEGCNCKLLHVYLYMYGCTHPHYSLQAQPFSPHGWWSCRAGRTAGRRSRRTAQDSGYLPEFELQEEDLEELLSMEEDTAEELETDDIGVQPATNSALYFSTILCKQPNRQLQQLKQHFLQELHAVKRHVMAASK